MQPRIFELVEHNHASLCIVTRPSSENLKNDLEYLKGQGIEFVVSLLTKEETIELGLGDEAEICRNIGIEYINHAILDRGIPSHNQLAIKLVSDIHIAWRTGKTVGIHCRAGIGRSGMIATAVLLRDGMQLSDAVSQVSKGRGLKTPDTEEQVLWISDNQQQLMG